MNKFQRSWALMKSSLSVIARNKELLVFPIVVFCCTVAIVAFFLAPPLLRPTGNPYTSAQHWQTIYHSLFKSTGNNSQVVFTRGAVVYMTLLYFVAMFIATFCNVAFYHEIMAALSGQPVSIVRGLRFAGTRLPSILVWTLFAGLVGLLIKTIEERMQIVGQIVGKIVGIAWSIAAVFAVPVIVRQESTLNPLAILRNSAGALKRTWGEALIGYVGLSFANGLIAIATAIVAIGSIMLSATLNMYLFAVIVIPGWFLLLFAWAYLTSVAGHVYRGALYLYASEGIVPAPYDQQMLDMAWKFRK